MVSKIFLWNKKGLVGISVIIFLVLVFWGIQVPKAEAVDYSYLHIKIDSFGTTALWQFHGFNTYPHNISGDGLYAIGSAPSGYQCALWLVEEFSLTSDVVSVVWTKAGNRLQRSGTSISNDLTDKTYVGNLCSTTYIDSGLFGTLVCDNDEPLWDIPTQTAIFPYGAVDALGGGEDRTLSDSIVNTYRPDVDILCAGPNLWKTCEANDCATIGANQWACNGGTGVWTNCTGPTPFCLGGVCQPAAVCTYNNPTVTLSPPSQNGAPGDTRTYIVSVTNNNTAACLAETYTLVGAVPLGWGSAFPLGNTIALNAGQTGTRNFDVTSAGPPGTYTVSVTATGGGGGLSGTGSASYIVSSCPAGFSVSFGGTKIFSKTDNFLISYTSSGNFCASIDRISGGAYNFWQEDTTSGVTSRTNYNTGVAGDGYVSTGYTIRATINNALGCDPNSLCRDEIQIVQCTKNSDCTGGETCNLTTNTCQAAAPCGPFDGICPPACTNPPDLDCPAVVATCNAGDGCLEGCIPPDPDCPPSEEILINPAKYQSIEELIETIINIIVYIALSLAVLLILIAGFLFITSRGNPEQIATAKRMLLYILIGFAVALLAKGLAAVLKAILGVP